jgi:hypothetical protein
MMLHGCGQLLPRLWAGLTWTRKRCRCRGAALPAGLRDFSGTMPIVHRQVLLLRAGWSRGAAHVMHASAFVSNRSETFFFLLFYVKSNTGTNAHTYVHTYIHPYECMHVHCFEIDEVTTSVSLSTGTSSPAEEYSVF